MGPERRIGKGGSGPVEGPVTGGRGAEGRIWGGGETYERDGLALERVGTFGGERGKMSAPGCLKSNYCISYSHGLHHESHDWKRPPRCGIRDGPRISCVETGTH